MVFRKIASVEPVVALIVRRISSSLQDGKAVLWLLSGGSFIEIQIEAAQKLARLDLSKLTVSLTDERYGPIGHAGSNWQKLLDKGFDLPNANLFPILQGQDFESTTKNFSGFLNAQLSKDQLKIACVGVGADGHTLGVLCHSTVVRSTALAASYNGSDFRRITMTPKSLGRLDETIVYMDGAEKRPIIEQLANDKISLEKQPAQALKKLDNVIVFNDYLERVT